MSKQSLLANLVVWWLPSAGTADFVLSSSPEFLDSADGTQEIEIILTANDDFTGIIGAIGFDFDTGSEAWNVLNPSDFHWVPEEMHVDAPLVCDLLPCWELDEGLPSPQAVWGGPFDGYFYTPPGEPIIFATLTVNQDQVFDHLMLPTGLQVFDLAGFPLEVKGGDELRFYIPEPTTLTLLAIAALASVRRPRN